MQLPLEIAMEVGSFLNAHDLTVSTTQLRLKGVKFVARPITDRNATMRIRLDQLIWCLSSSSSQPTAQRKSAQWVAQEAAKRIEFCLTRRANVAKIASHHNGFNIMNEHVYAELYRHFQHAAQVQPNQNQAITVEWHLSRARVTQVAGLVELGSATAPSSEAAVHPRYRQQLMLNNLYVTHTDVSVLASCQSLHTLDLSGNEVTNVSVLASCQSLHTLDLSETIVADVSALASCQLLHTLNLSWSRVTDVSALASCPSLHTLDLSRTRVTDVSALSSCLSLHTLDLSRSRVTDVSALVSCVSLYNLNVSVTQVSNVAGLAASKSLHTLNLIASKVRDVSALQSCVSLRKIDGASGIAGYRALLRLLFQRQ
jgi:hypothetical protein